MASLPNANQTARIVEKLYRELGTFVVELMQDVRTERTFSEIQMAGYGCSGAAKVLSEPVRCRRTKPIAPSQR